MTPYHTFAHPDYAYAAHSGRGVLVPQQVYQPNAGYVRMRTIRFSCRGVPGVRLVDAENGGVRNLDDPTCTPTVNPNGNRITLRIMWPGYGDWAINNVSVKHHTAQGELYTMVELATAIASRIREFYSNMRDVPCNAAGWSTHQVPFENLYLLELRHVGQSSWQPVLTFNP